MHRQDSGRVELITGRLSPLEEKYPNVRTEVSASHAVEGCAPGRSGRAGVRAAEPYRNCSERPGSTRTSRRPSRSATLKTRPRSTPRPTRISSRARLLQLPAGPDGQTRHDGSTLQHLRRPAGRRERLVQGLRQEAVTRTAADAERRDRATGRAVSFCASRFARNIDRLAHPLKRRPALASRAARRDCRGNPRAGGKQPCVSSSGNRSVTSTTCSTAFSPKRCGAGPRGRARRSRPASGRRLADVSETEGEYLIKAELPEVRKEDVSITVQDGVLTLAGERKQEKARSRRRPSHRTLLRHVRAALRVA